MNLLAIHSVVTANPCGFTDHRLGTAAIGNQVILSVVKIVVTHRMIIKNELEKSAKTTSNTVLVLCCITISVLQ